MATNIYWDGATATYAGPAAPSLPTPFWLDNSAVPYILNYWLGAPDYQYVPMGEIDATANTFTPYGTGGATNLSPMTVVENGDGTYTFTAPNGGTSVTIKEFDIDRLPDSSVWTAGDTVAKETAAGIDQEADADAYFADVLQSGPQTSAVLAALSTGNPAAAVVEEILVGVILPLSAEAGDIAWLETGTIPNRLYTEHIFLNASWQETGRTFDEATLAFTEPSAPVVSGSAAGHVAVFYQQEARGVGGGDLPGGGWRDRILNTQQFNEITGLTLNAASGELSFAPSATSRNFWIRGRAALGFYYNSQGFVAVHLQARMATTGGVQQIVGESCFGSNQDGSSQSGNTIHACLEGVLTVPAGGGSYLFQHVNNWAFSSWDSKQGEAVGRGMDLVNMTTLGGLEVYATLSLQEIA